MLEGNDLTGKGPTVGDNFKVKSVLESQNEASKEKQKSENTSIKETKNTKVPLRTEELKPAGPPVNSKKECKKSKFCNRHQLF